MVVAKQPTETLSTCDRPFSDARFFDGIDQAVTETLVVSFVVIEFHKLVDRRTKRVLAEEDHANQAALLDRAHEPLRVSVQIR